MERATKIITTPITQKEVKVVEYLTGREAEYIQEELTLAAKPTLNERNGVAFGEFTRQLINAGKHALITVAVKEFDGSNENILDRLRDLPDSDYEFVVDALNELSKKK